MNVFCVDYSNFVIRAKKLSELVGETINNIRELNDVVKELDIFWDGDSNDEFVIAVGEDIAKVMVVLDIVRALVRELIEAFDEYQETEKIIGLMIEEVSGRVDY